MTAVVLKQDQKRSVLGIIGGSGLYDLPEIANAEWRKVDSPWGQPSDDLLFGKLGELNVVFLPRHGRHHRIPPLDINYRANIDAFKRAGVTDLISFSACGSLKEVMHRDISSSSTSSSIARSRGQKPSSNPAALRTCRSAIP